LYVVDYVKLLLWLIEIDMLYSLLFIYVFYLGFALSVSVYRRWLGGYLSLPNKIVFAPVLGIFLLFDILLNFLIILVFGFPPKNAYTLSKRFEKYRLNNSGIKKSFATFICERFLNEIDPTGQHC
jgi:hypothetical protein